MTGLDPAGLEAAAKDLIEAYDAWSVNSYPADGGSSTHAQAWFQEAQHVENAVEKLRAAYLSVQEQQEQEACSYCGEFFPKPVELHHAGAHCVRLVPSYYAHALADDLEKAMPAPSGEQEVAEAPAGDDRCLCGHTAHWHGASIHTGEPDDYTVARVPMGTGCCDYSADCDCSRFRAAPLAAGVDQRRVAAPLPSGLEGEA